MAPWAAIIAPNIPETDNLFIDQAKVYQRIADKYGIPVEKLKTSDGVTNATNVAIEKEARAEAAKNGRTPEFQAWVDETKKQGQQVQVLLNEFYVGRDAQEDVKLNVSEDGEILTAGPENSKPANLTPEEAQTLLLTRRAEMMAFTEFLKSRYFAEGNSSTEPAVSNDVAQEQAA